MNKLKEISNLQAVSENLRVLILSKNQIESIKIPMDTLKNLDVLDLHDNKISTIENINKLQTLRVLNLSNNQIDVLDNLSGMKNLSELNLRKNKISQIKELTGLNSL
jgi:internalin A